MLLRRITEHVKAQNWTAVALDFFIVVVGVFIGIQVSNWNALRVEREQEQDYLLRLNEEVGAIITDQASDRVDVMDRANTLKEVAAYFDSVIAGPNNPIIKRLACETPV